jgi:predicted nucleic acid-binding protein
LAIDTLDTFAPVLPITHAVMRRVPDLASRYPRLQARDLVHVATCIHEGITEIISPDRGFDDVAEVKRIDPLAFVA